MVVVVVVAVLVAQHLLTFRRPRGGLQEPPGGPRGPQQAPQEAPQEAPGGGGGGPTIDITSGVMVAVTPCFTCFRKCESTWLLSPISKYHLMGVGVGVG